MDLAALRARMRDLSGVQMATLLTDAEADAFLNEAYQTVCGAAEWSFLDESDDVVADGSGSYATTVQRVQDVSHDGRGLQPRSRVELARYPAHRRTGDPWAWAPDGDLNVQVFPAPWSGTVTVRGWSAPGALAPVGEPVFDADFHQVVAYEAAANVLDAEAVDADRAEAFRAEVASVLSRMARRYLPLGGEVAYRGTGGEEGGE